MKDLLKSAALAMSISSIIATEQHYIITALLILFCIVLNFFYIRLLFPTVLGMLNYLNPCISGGFIGGILLAIGSRKIGRNANKIILLAGIIFVVASVLVVTNSGIMDCEIPFKLSWWFELALYLLVGATCSTLTGKVC